MPTFEHGKSYTRSELHDQYGGNRQSGIAGCGNHPIVFLFSSPRGHENGYKDGWVKDGPHAGCYRYTGEGQRGDMSINSAGNKAIRNHLADGRALHLFHRGKGHKKGSPYTYEGELLYVTHEPMSMPDADGRMREGIVFYLRDITTPNALHEEQADYCERPSDETHQTDELARAKKRAQGHCELCGKPAPFLTTEGTPYLDTRWLVDHDWILRAVMLCPNCYREAQFGARKHDILDQLAAIAEGD